MATYYVRPDGNNTNAGTGPATNQAWATITKAAQTMASGDTVWIAPGTYREGVSLSISGSSPASRIKYYGDPLCTQFAGVTPGPVKICTLDTATPPGGDVTAFSAGGISNIEVQDLDISMAGTALALGGTGCIVRRCRAYGAYNGAQLGGDALAEDCIFTGGQIGLAPQGTAVTATYTRCFVSGGMYGIEGGGNVSLTITNCIIRNGITKSGQTLTVRGCLFYGPANTGDIACIYVSASTAQTYDGCAFFGAHRGIQDQTATGGSFTVRGCYFENCAIGVYRNSDSTAPTLAYNQFRRCRYGFYVVMASSFNTCGFDEVSVAASGSGAVTATFASCLAHALNALVTTVVASGAPTYGAFTPVAGNAVTTASPISGAKSLRMKGYGYAPVFTQNVACEKGKAKTIKMKVKLASASDSVTIRLGNQSATTTATTAVQTITLTYTHYDTELLPLVVTSVLATTNEALIDDIAA